MCDRSNSQDMKLLLLASLVDERFSGISDNQEELRKGIEEANKKITTLIDLVEEYTQATKTCPITQNKDAVRSWMYILKHPKAFSWVLVVLLGVLIALFSTEVVSWLKILG